MHAGYARLYMYRGLHVKSLQFYSILTVIVMAGHYAIARIGNFMTVVSAVLQLL